MPVKLNAVLSKTSKNIDNLSKVQVRKQLISRIKPRKGHNHEMLVI